MQNLMRSRKMAEFIRGGHFYTFQAAAGAVEHFWGDHYSVELRPQDGNFFAQAVIVWECCDSGIADFAVQSAADHVVPVFAVCFCIYVLLVFYGRPLNFNPS